MSPDLPIDLEINLKKRARKRLVGAIALVLLMLIVLPIILQDRTSLTQTEGIKITMPEPVVIEPLQPELLTSQLESNEAVQEELVINDVINEKVAELEKKPIENPALANIQVKKPAELKPVITKSVESKTLQVNDNAGYTIQIGVYSDIANVKQIQDKLNQAGLTSNTEKIATPKGKKIRLNAGSFATREAANASLVRLQPLKIEGFVRPKSL